jgi:hypothetical protein
MATLEQIETRGAWSDRFRTPSMDDLLGPLPRAARTAMVHASATLTTARGFTESLRWHGVWKWSCSYESPAATERAAAYLIPDPQRPRLCVPVCSSAAAMLQTRSTPAFIRHALESCPVVDGVHWPIWQVEGKQMINELFAAVLPG